MTQTQIRIVLAALVALLSWGRVEAQPLGVGDVAAIYRAVYEAERPNLGTGSTRDGRNAFLARVVGIVVFGHPRFNPNRPDPRWCLKDGGAGRPQSDDVVVICATREAWDLVGGIGADNFSFREDPIGILPAGQNVFAPPRPSDAGTAPGGTGGGGGGAGTGSTPPAALNLAPVLEALARLEAKLGGLEAEIAATKTAAESASAGAASAALDSKDLARFVIHDGKLDPFKASPPCYVGRVPKAFGGSSEVRFCRPEPPQ